MSGRHAHIPRCSAHGTINCAWCSLIRSADLARGQGECPSCESWGATGMHWDTCGRRIRGPVDLGRARAVR